MIIKKYKFKLKEVKDKFFKLKKINSTLKK